MIIFIAKLYNYLYICNMKRAMFILILSFCSSVKSLCNNFSVVQNSTVTISIPKSSRPVVGSAVDMFADDISAVLGCDLKTVYGAKAANIILDYDRSLPFEGFRIKVNDGTLYIYGADDHGLAYGLLEISSKMGVSPWVYWADCTPRHRKSFTLEDGFVQEESPAVAYRGIFINDEDWGLLPWASKQEPEAFTMKQGRIKGAIGPKVNEKIFQLMLRLHANYYWPAMHECSQPFFTIDGNREMAAKYGIYIGGSHCEPMATSPAAEWGVRGKGDYNYVTNKSAVQSFWQERLNEIKDQEIVYTIGMRGVHDGAMQGVRTDDEKLKYLQMVIDDQRGMLSKTLGKKAEDIPQVFVPYKEVLDVYKSGLNVPDDVTLMWTDDNYGYIRHFPDSVEHARSGGNGLYYHVSYWGRPHDYLWLSAVDPDVVQKQLYDAYKYGIRKMWILNVGDIKPSEFLIELFMRSAWYGQELHDFYMTQFCVREFGKKYEPRLSSVMSKYFTLASECKPEHLAGTRTEEADKAYWNKIHALPGYWSKEEIAERVKDYQEISDEVEKLYRIVDDEHKDAFFQLVKYPVQAAAQMNFKFLCPERCEAAYDSIQSLTYIYNKVCAGGKWDGIMDASPRNLPVFAKVTPEQLFTDYPEKSEWKRLQGTYVREQQWDGYDIDAAEYTDSVTLQVRLFPGHPVIGDKLSFQLVVDGVSLPVMEYQTVGRSEEWKQNVLRGYAVREVTVALDKSRKSHYVVFKPLAERAELLGIYKKMQ